MHIIAKYQHLPNAKNNIQYIIYRVNKQCTLLHTTTHTHTSGPILGNTNCHNGQWNSKQMKNMLQNLKPRTLLNAHGQVNIVIEWCWMNCVHYLCLNMTSIDPILQLPIAVFSSKHELNLLWKSEGLFWLQIAQRIHMLQLWPSHLPGATLQTKGASPCSGCSASPTNVRSSVVDLSQNERKIRSQ